MAISIFPKQWLSKPLLGAQLNRGHPLAMGLVGVILINEGGGQSLYDKAYDKVGTFLTGSSVLPTWVPFVDGVGLNFDGDKAYVSFGNILRNSIFTKVAWVQLQSASPSFSGTICGLGQQAPQFRYNTSAQLELLSGATASIGTSSVSLTTKPCMVAVTYDASGNYVFYLNGVNVGSGTNLVSFSFSDSYYIGQRENTFTEGFFGNIGKILEYSRVLSASEILSLYVNPYAFLQPQSPQDRYWVVGIPAGAVSNYSKLQNHMRPAQFRPGNAR